MALQFQKSEPEGALSSDGLLSSSFSGGKARREREGKRIKERKRE